MRNVRFTNNLIFFFLNMNRTVRICEVGKMKREIFRGIRV